MKRLIAIIIAALVSSSVFADVPNAYGQSGDPEAGTDDSTESTVVPGTKTFVDLNTDANIASIQYSTIVDTSLVCMYNPTTEPPTLIVNEALLFSKRNLLFGTSNPGHCPLPGSKMLGNYPNAIAGEFLISGVVCVVNSIIMDSMFRIYCTMILWMFQIIYSLCVVYIMFYGLAIMLGIGQDPLRDAPRRIIKITIIFALATNAQFGFKIIHQMFINTLDTFTEMLVDLQPPYTEDGQPAYGDTDMLQSLINSIGGGIINKVLGNTPALLDMNGDKWKPVPVGTEYYDVEQAIAEGVNLDTASPATIGTYARKIENVPSDLDPLDSDKVQNYVPFRVPAMQWQYKKMLDPNDPSLPPLGVQLLQVFQDTTSGNSLPANKIAAIVDIVWNSAGRSKDGSYGRFELYPRKEKNNWPTLPNISPYGQYYVYDTVTLKHDVTPIGDDPITYPARLMDIAFTGGVPDNTSTCNEMWWWTCRKPFQGVLGKIDAMFNSVMGDDSSKNLSSMALALASWGIGGGFMLSILLMTGITSMFVAFIQLLWTYITAVMAISFLLMLSPLFLSFGLFKITDKLFKGWLANLISYTMQPFLITVFIYILAHITTLDTLSKLAREEVTTKVYQGNLVGDNSSARYTAPGFIEPLYYKPKSPDPYPYDKWVSTDATKADNAYINGMQRQKYLDNVQDFFMSWYLLDNNFGAAAKTQAQQKAKDLLGSFKDRNSADMELWFDGKYPKPVTVGGTTVTYSPTKKQRMAVLLEYWMAAHATDTANTSRYEKIMDAYYGTSNLDGTPMFPGVDGVGDFDDGDALTGENNGGALTGAIGSGYYNIGRALKGEYPPCIKNCPGFKPVYSPKDNPDPTADTCTKHCMYLPNDKENRFQKLLSAVLAWIVMNMLASAFISKVPELAKSLSSWNSYPTAPAIGEASKVFGADHRDAWTKSETGGVYHMGGLFDTGILSGQAGAIPGGIDKLMRGMQGDKYVYDQNSGRFVKQPREPYWKFGGLLNMHGDDPMTDIAKKINEGAFPGISLDNANQTDLVLSHDFDIQTRSEKFTRSQIMQVAKQLLVKGMINAGMPYPQLRDKILEELRKSEQQEKK